MAFEEEENESSKKTLITILVLLLLALLGALLYFWNEKSNIEQEAKQLKIDKEREILALKTDLDTFKGRNTQLDSLINASNIELDQRSRSLDSLLAIGQISREQLMRFRRENGKLDGLRSRYLRQIDSLLKINEQLRRNNTALRDTLAVERGRATQIADENVQLYNRISKAEVLKADNIAIQGVRYRSSGKEIEARRTRQIEKLKASFQLLENVVAKPGNRDVHLVAITPQGTTLYSEENGSGLFITEGKQTRYTQKATINYENKTTPITMYYTEGPNTKFAEGTYQIQVYCDGVRIGEGSFDIK
jgi:hypothetical protein